MSFAVWNGFHIKKGAFAVEEGKGQLELYSEELHRRLDMHKARFREYLAVQSCMVLFPGWSEIMFSSVKEGKAYCKGVFDGVLTEGVKHSEKSRPDRNSLIGHLAPAFVLEISPGEDCAYVTCDGYEFSVLRGFFKDISALYKFK